MIRWASSTLSSLGLSFSVSEMKPIDWSVSSWAAPAPALVTGLTTFRTAESDW